MSAENIVYDVGPIQEIPAIMSKRNQKLFKILGVDLCNRKYMSTSAMGK